jgi:hypothetical protein
MDGASARRVPDGYSRRPDDFLGASMFRDE